MNEELYMEVWGEPPPHQEEAHDLEEVTKAEPDGDIVTTIRTYLSEIRISQAQIAKLTKDLASIELGLRQALDSLAKAAPVHASAIDTADAISRSPVDTPMPVESPPQPAIVEKVISRARKRRPQTKPATEPPSETQ